MKHYFIVNPMAAYVKDHIHEIVREVEIFFRKHNNSNYDIHVTRWVRDAMGYANRLAMEATEPVRIHAMGGSGTLYEIINATVGLPNVQIAAYPMGSSNFFIRYFGAGNEHLFKSLANQVFSGVIRIDAIRYLQNHAVGYAMVGLDKIPRSSRVCRRYELIIDGQDYSGEYATILIASSPYYGKDMTPAPHAHPNDALMDIYLVRKTAGLKLIQVMRAFLAGEHEKTNGFVLHEHCKSVTVSADSGVTVSMDGEILSERSMSYEIVPSAVDFVCPDSIDIRKLPARCSSAGG